MIMYIEFCTSNPYSARVIMLTQAEKEASLFIYEHMKSENTSVCYGMYMVLMIVKLAENSSINLFFLVGITTKELFPI